MDSDVMDSDVIDSDVIDSDVMDSDVMDSDVMDSDVMDSDVFDSDVLDNDVLIGFTILSVDDAEGKSGSAEFRIALNPNMLGQGAGERLAKMTIEKGFEELGPCLQKIYLIVRKNNPRAKRLYEHCGFHETGECRKMVNGINVDFFLRWNWIG